MHRVPHHNSREQQIQERSGIELVFIRAIADFSLTAEEELTGQGIEGLPFIESQQRPSKVEAIQPSGCNRWRTLLCCKRITRIDREKELPWFVSQNLSRACKMRWTRAIFLPSKV